MRRMIAAGPSAKRPPHRAFGPAAPGPAGSRSPGSDPGGAGCLLASFGTVAVALLLAVGHAFSVRGLPTTLIIDSGGKVVGRVEGAAEWDSDKMAKVLQPFLPEVSEDAKLKRAER